VLNRLRSGPPANLFKNRLASGAIGAGNAHFDHPAAFQTAIDFSEDRGRQSGSADQHDRIERVRSGLQFAPPGG
jgi:hypothetical protein